jgi:hypothetical protein
LSTALAAEGMLTSKLRTLPKSGHYQNSATNPARGQDRRDKDSSLPKLPSYH